MTLPEVFLERSSEAAIATALRKWTYEMSVLSDTNKKEFYSGNPSLEFTCYPAVNATHLHPSTR